MPPTAAAPPASAMPMKPSDDVYIIQLAEAQIADRRSLTLLHRCINHLCEAASLQVVRLLYMMSARRHLLRGKSCAHLVQQ